MYFGNVFAMHASRSCLRRAQSTVLVVGTSSFSCLGRSTPLATSRRSYYHHIPEDLVPEGQKTDKIHSSSVPSERMKVLREYALGPVFGSRRAVCRLGFTMPRKALMDVKPDLPAVLAELLEVDVDDIELGPIEMLQDRLLHRAKGDALCPRVSHVDGRRVADSFVAVYLKPSSPFTDEDVSALGDVLLAMFQLEEAAALEVLGVRLVELESDDVSDFTFSSFGGDEVTEQDLEEVATRWEQRMLQQESTSVMS
jgi:hypothetical protein